MTAQIRSHRDDAPEDPVVGSVAGSGTVLHVSAFPHGAVTGHNWLAGAVRSFGYGADGIAGELAHLEEGYEIYGDVYGELAEADEVAILACKIAARQLAP